MEKRRQIEKEKENDVVYHSLVNCGIFISTCGMDDTKHSDNNKPQIQPKRFNWYNNKKCTRCVSRSPIECVLAAWLQNSQDW